MNLDIQALINLKIPKNNLEMKNRKKSVRDTVLWLNQKWLFLL